MSQWIRIRNDCKHKHQIWVELWNKACCVLQSHLSLITSLILYVGYTVRTPGTWLTRFCDRLPLKSGSHKSKIVSQICGVLIVYPTMQFYSETISNGKKNHPIFQIFCQDTPFCCCKLSSFYRANYLIARSIKQNKNGLEVKLQTKIIGKKKHLNLLQRFSRNLFRYLVIF